MRPRWQKVFSDLRGNLGRTTLVIASIAVGLFAFGVIATLYVVIRQDMREGYAAVQPANIRLRTSFVDDDMLSSIRDLPGVEEIQGSHYRSRASRKPSGMPCTPRRTMQRFDASTCPGTNWASPYWTRRGCDPAGQEATSRQASPSGLCHT